MINSQQVPHGGVEITPLSPPSAPAQRRFQFHPAKNDLGKAGMGSTLSSHTIHNKFTLRQYDTVALGYFLQRPFSPPPPPETTPQEPPPLKQTPV